MTKTLILKFLLLTTIITSLIWMLFKVEYLILRNYLDKQVEILSQIEETNSYIEVGYASYYTTKSCKAAGDSGVWTASGERFDENKLSCARAKRSDLGKTYLVTNTVNGKSVKAVCNDLGVRRKFKENRIIDLSKAAFKQIESLDKGLVKVEVKEL